MPPQQKLIPANLPVYCQCQSVPVEWRVAQYLKEPAKTVSELMKRAAQPNTDVLEVQVKQQGGAGKPTLFDPVKKRNEFFRLEEGDLEGLLCFLNSVGLFERADQAQPTKQPRTSVFVPSDHRVVHYVEQISAKHIWKMRELLQRRLEKHKEVEVGDFEVRFRRVKGQLRIVLTTSTFMDSLFLTLHVDRIRQAKVQKCARPDCGIVFSASSGHVKKYCERKCAHIESVRRDRERKKAQQQKGR